LNGEPRSCACVRYARTTDAVVSGRRVSDLPPLSSNVYISLVTTSEVSPDVRENSSVCSNVGVSV